MTSYMNTIISDSKIEVKIFTPDDKLGTYVLFVIPESYRVTEQYKAALLLEINALRQDKQIEDELYLLEKRKTELLTAKNKLSTK